MPNKTIRVFISYTHDSPNHSAKVLKLSNALRDLGFEADIDQYHVNQRWPQWMEERIEWADYVLIVCTQTYLRRWKGQETPGVGLGAQWESLLTRVTLYQSPSKNDKFVPIVFSNDDIQYIPIPLADVTRVVVGQDLSNLRALNLRLLNLPPAVMPPISTSLHPIATAPGFFNQVPHDQGTGTELTPEAIGLSSEPEELTSNLLKIHIPDKIHTAQIKLRKVSDFEHIMELTNHRSGRTTPPPVDYLRDHKTLYTFTNLKEGLWSDLIREGTIVKLDAFSASKWAQSNVFAEKNLFIKLLNQCLRSLCQHNGTSFDINFSKEMRCRLFAPKQNSKGDKLSKTGRLKALALKSEATRTVFQAIPDKKSDDPDSIQHWQHEAFRNRFVRFGGEWFLVLTPFWAFTFDGISQPSKWQKRSSSNMRKPERNRAVLGHIAFWQAVLCKAPDMLNPENTFRIERCTSTTVSPSIQDSEWMNMAKAEERKELETDNNLLL